MKVLLVEDNAAQRELLSQILRLLAGVEIAAVAATQEEAVTWLRNHAHDWDLALIDLFLAQGNGFAVLRQCAGRAPAQKVALMSNYTDGPVRERAAAAGADAFFDKGSEISALLEFCLRTHAAVAAQYPA
jgi:DNA-binding NarL/FixJ family response regulator